MALLRTLLLVTALVAAAFAATANIPKPKVAKTTTNKNPMQAKSDLVQKQWKVRIAASEKSRKATGAAVVKGLKGEEATGVKRALAWLKKYTYPKILADITNFAGLLRLESLSLGLHSDPSFKSKLLTSWPRNLTGLQHVDTVNLRTTVDALVVRISGESSGPQIHSVRVALSKAGASVLKWLKTEQAADTALLNKQLALFK